MNTVRRALVVGGTRGIGYAMACRIASEAKAATVIISGRTKPENIPHPNIEFQKIDASSMRGIKEYTDQYKASQQGTLDLLVITQGIMTLAGRTETAEGIDQKMALHFYGRQLLIRELMPVLSDDAKVVLVLDSLVGNPNKLNWDDLDLKNTFALSKAADHCTTMNDAMVQEFAAQQGGANKRYFIHAFPGFVKTSLATSLPLLLRPALHALLLFATAPETAAEHLVRGTFESAKAGEKEGRGWGYINSKGNPVPNKPVWTEEQRKKVADHTWKIIDDALKVPA